MDFFQTTQHGIQRTTVYFTCTLRKWTIFLWTCIKYGWRINSHRVYVSNELAFFQLFIFNWRLRCSLANQKHRSFGTVLICWCSLLFSFWFFSLHFLYILNSSFPYICYRSHPINALHWISMLLFTFFIADYPIHECCHSNTMTYMHTIMLIVWGKTMFTVRQHFVTAAFRWLNWHWDNMRNRWISCKTTARREKQNGFNIDDVFFEIVIQ